MDRLETWVSLEYGGVKQSYFLHFASALVLFTKSLLTPRAIAMSRQAKERLRTEYCICR